MCRHSMLQPLRMLEATQAAGPPQPGNPIKSKQIMKHLGIKTAILSVTAPGPCIFKGQPSYDLARKLNEYGAHLRDQEPQHFGLFASLPNLLDTEAALTEISYALDTLNADGVTLFTRYGDSNTYLGNPALEPIRAELNRRKCVVFVHPTHPADTTPVNQFLPQPAIDYPIRDNQNSHGHDPHGHPREVPRLQSDPVTRGGALPYLITRIGTPMRKAGELGMQHDTGPSYEKVMAAFRSFYYDLALSTAPSVLDLALNMIPHDYVLYGSNFPYAPPPAYPAFLEDLEGYEMSKELRDMINFGNARQLIPRLIE